MDKGVIRSSDEPVDAGSYTMTADYGASDDQITSMDFIAFTYQCWMLQRSVRCIK